MKAKTETPAKPSSPRRSRLAPPKPKLAFRVGIVDPRPAGSTESNSKGIRQVLKEILASVKDEVAQFARHHHDLYDGAAPPIFRAYSSLSKGAELDFAEDALGSGWDLGCVLPYERIVFEKDFELRADAGREAANPVHRLLEAAAFVFELDGNRTEVESARKNAHHIILNQSDLLIAVIDLEGDSAQVLLEHARHGGIPALAIDAPSGQWRWFGSSNLATEEALREAVTEALLVPTPPPVGKHHAPVVTPPGPKPLADPLHKASHTSPEQPIRELKRFYSEPQPKYNWAIFWRIFRDVVADLDPKWVSTKVKPFEDAVLDDWPREFWLTDRLRPYFAWTDKLADLYADQYRSAFLLGLSFSALAVGLALAPIALEKDNQWRLVLTICEFFSILAICVVVMCGRWAAWHEKWIDYRFAAEEIRHLKLVAVVGGKRPFPQIPAHHAYWGPPAATWMHWYVSGVARETGLPSVVLDHGYLMVVLSQLKKDVSGQLEFHVKSAIRAHNMEHRLYYGVLGSLVVTLIACLLHGLMQKYKVNAYEDAMTIICGFFPAVGAALVGISNQGEFRRVAKRSQSMQQDLKSLLNRIDLMSSRMDEDPDRSWSKDVRLLAEEAASLMLHEVMDWRVVFLDRPLEF